MRTYLKLLGWALAMGPALAAGPVAGHPVARAQDVPVITGNTNLDGLMNYVSQVQGTMLNGLVLIVLVGIVVFYVNTWAKGKTEQDWDSEG